MWGRGRARVYVGAGVRVSVMVWMVRPVLGGIRAAAGH
jgi:hypothetical protein